MYFGNENIDRNVKESEAVAQRQNLSLCNGNFMNCHCDGYGE